MTVFGNVLKSTCKLQSTRSPRLPNGFWWFLAQNKAEVLLVLFLRFVYYFCLLKTGETFKRSLELSFFLASFEKNTNGPKWPWYQNRKQNTQKSKMPESAPVDSWWGYPSREVCQFSARTVITELILEKIKVYTFTNSGNNFAYQGRTNECDIVGYDVVGYVKCSVSREGVALPSTMGIFNDLARINATFLAW